MRSIRFSKLRQALRLVRISGLAVLVALTLNSPVAVGALTMPSTERAELFVGAAKEFGVPKELLLAVSYNQSRWTPHGGLPSSDNGFGIMNLRTKIVRVVNDAKGDPAASEPRENILKATHYSLDDAAELLDTSAENLKTNERQNIRGAAAVLAAYARSYDAGKLPISLGDWYAAVAAYSGYDNAGLATAFADDVYSSLQQGEALITPDNQSLAITPNTGVQANRSQIAKLNLAPEPMQTLASGTTDCPAVLNCRFVPAAYAATSDNPTDYGNWDPANRPKDLKIRYIVIHDTEGTYQSAISWIQNPISRVSAHYVIRSSDGEVTQMVRTQDVAWGAGNWFMNPHSINIEHEGFAAQGQVWFTEAMYRSSATLVRWLAKKYDIPLDRQHIVGHDDIPRLSLSGMAAAHSDPGPYWDWNHYMELLNAPIRSNKPVTNNTKVLTITPNFASNQPMIQQCLDDLCTDLPAQGANVVYLHTQPSADAPLLTNPYLHPDGAPGTNEIGDWSSTVDIGDKFAVADKQGDWVGIWFGGQIGWLHNPSGSNKTASSSKAKVVTPKAGRASIPVYPGAYPEAAAFPSTIPVQALPPIYTMPAGQFYPASDKEASDYFYDATIDFSLPDDHMIVRGNDTYYRISFNHRIGYVKTSDVDVKNW